MQETPRCRFRIVDDVDMEDPAEFRERMERLVRRVNRRDDYGKLIAAGYVIVSADEVGDAEEWRREIRRQARADRLGVRTGERREHTLWALLQDVDRSERVAEEGGMRNCFALPFHER